MSARQGGGLLKTSLGARVQSYHYGPAAVQLVHDRDGGRDGVIRWGQRWTGGEDLVQGPGLSVARFAADRNGCSEVTARRL